MLVINLYYFLYVLAVDHASAGKWDLSSTRQSKKSKVTSAGPVKNAPTIQEQLMVSPSSSRRKTRSSTNVFMGSSKSKFNKTAETVALEDNGASSESSDRSEIGFEIETRHHLHFSTPSPMSKRMKTIKDDNPTALGGNPLTAGHVPKVITILFCYICQKLAYVILSIFVESNEKGGNGIPG